MTKSSTKMVISYLNLVPNQIQHMNQDIVGLVETSLNLGILLSTEKTLEASAAIRSSVATRRQFLIEQLENMAELMQGHIEVSGAYPEWEYKKDSPLREAAVKLYRDMYQEEMVVDVIHAGLECGYLLQKKPELDVISVGPQMHDIHTTEERLSISSTEKMYQFVRKLIEEMR